MIREMHDHILITCLIYLCKFTSVVSAALSAINYFKSLLIRIKDSNLSSDYNHLLNKQYAK